MRTPFSLLALALAAGLAGCATLGGISADEQAKLSTYQQNAANYYDRAHWERAYQQWGKALEIEPDNVKCRLGQAMVQYQLGRVRSEEGLQYLVVAEEAMADLLDDDLEGLDWQAQMGYALVQAQWVVLYDERVRLSELQLARGEDVDQKQLAADRAERSRRARFARESFEEVLAGGEHEIRDRLTCMLELARLHAIEGEYEASLAQCERYKQQVEGSKKFWLESAERFPKEKATWQAKIDGAERQEVELRDLMGNVLYKLERFDEAEAELDKVIAIQPKRDTAYLNRGLIRQSRGDWDRARADFESFLDCTPRPPSDPVVREVANRLDEVEALVEAEDELRRKVDERR